MQNYLIPAVGITVTTIILIIVNELTNTAFIKDYALILILVGMLLGVAFSKISVKSKKES